MVPVMDVFPWQRYSGQIKGGVAATAVTVGIHDHSWEKLTGMHSKYWLGIQSCGGRDRAAPTFLSLSYSVYQLSQMFLLLLFYPESPLLLKKEKDNFNIILNEEVKYRKSSH